MLTDKTAFAAKRELISRLQQNILSLQGFVAPVLGSKSSIGLGVIEASFPNGIFPAGTIHEFLSFIPEHGATCSGFIAGLLNTLMKQGGVCLWIGVSRTLFPPALKVFGIEPDNIIFIDLHREKDVLWAMEEALKCEGLAAVICELHEISFTQSRRLQLAVEQSRVTGFVLRSHPKKLSTTASAARWRITSLPSKLAGDMPGIGFPRWQVELLKVRNGTPGSWKMEWSGGQFNILEDNAIQADLPVQTRKAG